MIFLHPASLLPPSLSSLSSPSEVWVSAVCMIATTRPPAKGLRETMSSTSSNFRPTLIALATKATVVDYVNSSGVPSVVDMTGMRISL